MAKPLSEKERTRLLLTAREAITSAVNRESLPDILLEDLSAALTQDGASFVTLTIDGRLRGCIGIMEASQSLILDVQEHAVAAAMSDYRFTKVRSDELSQIKIEISRLTPLERLLFQDADDLTKALRIGVDGVLIKASGKQATFLPQVWEQLRDPVEFLTHLCMKMGALPDFWRDQPIDVYTYQVEKFEEK